VGRTGRYLDWITDDGLLLLRGFARDGFSDKEIAEKKIGVSVRTFTEWKARFPAIWSALKEGRLPADYAVEDSMHKSATGYIVKLKKPIKLKTKKQLKDKGTIEEERIEYADEEIYIPPNVTAQIFWLKNRRRDKWRDKPEGTEALENPILQSLYDLANHDGE
jgi:hypothetical protein